MKAAATLLTIATFALTTQAAFSLEVINFPQAVVAQN